MSRANNYIVLILQWCIFFLSVITFLGSKIVLIFFICIFYGKKTNLACTWGSSDKEKFAVVFKSVQKNERKTGIYKQSQFLRKLILFFFFFWCNIKIIIIVDIWNVHRMFILELCIYIQFSIYFCFFELLIKHKKCSIFFLLLLTIKICLLCQKIWKLKKKK